MKFTAVSEKYEKFLPKYLDHLYSSEHWNDLIIQKYLARSLVELYNNRITFTELSERIKETLYNKWNSIEELTDYNNSKNLSASFFFATSKGIGLAYNAEYAKPFVQHIIAAGHKVGIHGIARDTFDNIKKERERFQALHNQVCNGIRFHYLYPNTSILPKLEAAGYTYDSSLRGDSSSQIIGNLIHFPVHLMDGDVIMQKKRYQSVDLQQAMVYTVERLSRLLDNKTDYISILFHDRYFSPAHATWRDWYMATVEWIQSQGIVTTTYEDAVLEIRNRQLV